MAEQIITKSCNKCKLPKTPTEFSKSKQMKGGYRNDCKICQSKYQKEYNQTEKGRKAQKKGQKRYRQTEKCKIRNRRYNQSQKRKLARKRYQITEKYKLTRKNWHIQNPQYKKALNAICCAVKVDKLPRINTLPCHYCGEQAEQYHHHKGYAPEHRLDVIPLCKQCHRKIHLKSA